MVKRQWWSSGSPMCTTNYPCVEVRIKFSESEYVTFFLKLLCTWIVTSMAVAEGRNSIWLCILSGPGDKRRHRHTSTSQFLPNAVLYCFGLEKRQVAKHVHSFKTSRTTVSTTCTKACSIQGGQSVSVSTIPLTITLPCHSSAMRFVRWNE